MMSTKLFLVDMHILSKRILIIKYCERELKKQTLFHFVLYCFLINLLISYSIACLRGILLPQIMCKTCVLHVL